MGSIESSFFDIGHLDALSSKDTPIHRVDPRVKVLTTIYFIAVVISFNKYDPAGLAPLVIYPMAIMTIGNIPFSYIMKKLLIASPFVLSVALFNPILDRSPALDLGLFSVSGGFVSFASIAAKFVLTVSAGLALIACTGFDSICSALSRMGVPASFHDSTALCVQIYLRVGRRSRAYGAGEGPALIRRQRTGDGRLQQHDRAVAFADHGQGAKDTSGNAVQGI